MPMWTCANKKKADRRKAICQSGLFRCLRIGGVVLVFPVVELLQYELQLLRQGQPKVRCVLQNGHALIAQLERDHSAAHDTACTDNINAVLTESHITLQSLQHDALYTAKNAEGSMLYPLSYIRWSFRRCIHTIVPSAHPCQRRFAPDFPCPEAH